MNLLYVDGDNDSITLFKDAIDLMPHIHADIFKTKEEAVLFLNNNLVDIFIISFDGLIVNDEGGLSVDESMSFFRHILENAAFTPVYFLLSSNMRVVDINYLLSESHHMDIWGNGVSSPTIKVFSKDDFVALSSELAEVSSSISQIDLVAIDSGGKQLFLTHEQKRILKIFTKQFRGVSCHVKKLDGGLSQSRVLQIRIDDINGATRINAVAKLDTIKNIHKESLNFTQEISRLPVRAYAPQVGIVKGGAANSAGVFYRLLKSDDLSLFQLLAKDKILAAEVVTKLMQLLNSWNENRPRENVSIKCIRQEMISDEDVSTLSEKYDLTWIQEVERINVLSCKSTIHADLHGENVFVTTNNEPVMIDFGDVREGASIFDPITLELSLFTHPSNKASLEWLPDLNQCSWADLDTYLVNCPYSEFIKVCRTWSHNVAGGDQAVNAGAYAYLMRQLKYTDVDHELILELLKSVKNTILEQ